MKLRLLSLVFIMLIAWAMLSISSAYAVILQACIGLYGNVDPTDDAVIDRTGCACNYRYTNNVNSTSMVVRCPATEWTCSKNNYTGTIKVSSSSGTSTTDVSTFCLKKVGKSCFDDSWCEGTSLCKSGLCTADIGERSVKDILGGEIGDLRDTIRKFINIALGFLGLAAVIMVIYGGFVWLTAGGREDNVTKGKQILVWASLGMVVIAIAWTIASYVLRVGRDIGTG